MLLWREGMERSEESVARVVDRVLTLALRKRRVEEVRGTRRLGSRPGRSGSKGAKGGSVTSQKPSCALRARVEQKKREREGERERGGGERTTEDHEQV